MAAAIILCVEGGLLLHAAESYSAWRGQVFTNSWYAAVAVPWMLALLCSGAFSIEQKRLRACVLAGVPIVFAITEIYGVLVLMLPKYYSASALKPIWLVRMARIHPAMFGPTTLMLSSAAILLGMMTTVNKINRIL